MRELLRTKLDEAGGREIAVEREGASDPKRAHHREAGGIDERVFTLVVTAEPPERLRFLLLRDLHDREPLRMVEAIEEVNRRPVIDATVQERPGLTADVVCCSESIVPVLLDELDRSGVVRVEAKPEREPERGIDEDQRG